MRHDRPQALNPRVLIGNHSFMSNPLTGPILAFASRLRFPTLFWIVVLLFLVDLIIPDVIPPFFVDEILLGLGAILLARWKKPDTDDKGRVIEHEPPSPPPPPPPSQ